MSTTPDNTTPENKPVENKPKALGRGLAALINPTLPKAAAPAPTADSPVRVDTGIPSYAKLELIELALIEPNPEQPRKIFDPEKLKELSDSLREQGLVQPIVVRRKGDKFEIIAGERRWRAAKLAEIQKIPAIIRDDKNTVIQNDLASLVENLQREQLSPLELASAYERTMSAHQMTQEQLGSKVGVSRVSIANTLRLLKLPAEVKEMLASGKITEGHARSLLSLDDQKQMGEIAQKIVMKTLSVRDVEQEVRTAKTLKSNQESQAAVEQDKQKNASLEEELRRIFGTKVLVKNHAGRGTIEIYFTGPDSLHRILHQVRAIQS